MKSTEWIEDKDAKSLTYFSLQESTLVNLKLITKLENISIIHGNVNARLCLHNNPNQNLQDMVILEYRDKKCRKPHKHKNKDESLHIIKGEMMALTFNNEGKLVEKLFLNPINLMFRNVSGLYHVWIPTVEYVIYREIKQGTFKQEDNILPEWDYIKELKKHISFDLSCYNTSCKSPCALSEVLK